MVFNNLMTRLPIINKALYLVLGRSLEQLQSSENYTKEIKEL